MKMDIPLLASHALYLNCCNCYQLKTVLVCVLLLQLLERFVSENISCSQTFNETVQCVFFQPANFQPNVPYHIILSAACERVSVY